MASSSLQALPSPHHSPPAAMNAPKGSKPRTRPVVKPMLKKLHSHSHSLSRSISLSLSDRESLDLDRGWDDQPSPRLASLDPLDSHHHHHFHHHGNAAPRSPRDMIFPLVLPDHPTPISGAPLSATSLKFPRHARSASGASHASVATSVASACRNGGSFVHPFQQTPQTSTPPLSYSRVSLDTGSAGGFRDYSPTITEHDDDDDQPDTLDQDPDRCTRAPPSNPAIVASGRASIRPTPSLIHQSQSQQQRRRIPSLAASSVSDGTHPLRITASCSNSDSAKRLATDSFGQSRSELQLSTQASVADSLLSSTIPLTPSATAAAANTTTTTASSSATHMSPLRSSLDMGSFHLRTRSDIDTLSRQQHVREARRKFEARERAKEEKYAREQDRKRQRAQTKETHKTEREKARHTKGGHASLVSGVASGAAHRSARHEREISMEASGEKTVFSDAGYQHDDAASQEPPRPRADDVEFKSPRRSKTAKHKTMGMWTAFMLWLRTRLLKLRRR
ncbi:hypothetical protein CDD81_6086 [Ophiocordyceps australis]|uniref:Uncharacterized protein n=1 Tax=Ophiocordyceps australis TaxID=1399860 RepID=A0A2C5Y7T2_9HYPO|nr:hypothetical protein CDD81_6086 [Ophiocordyceps australis]